MNAIRFPEFFISTPNHIFLFQLPLPLLLLKKHNRWKIVHFFTAVAVRSCATSR